MRKRSVLTSLLLLLIFQNSICSIAQKTWQNVAATFFFLVSLSKIEKNWNSYFGELYVIFFWFLSKTDKSTIFNVFCLVRNHKIRLLNFFKKITKMHQKQQFDIIIRCLKLGSKRANFSLITNNFFIIIYNKTLF